MLMSKTAMWTACFCVVTRFENFGDKYGGIHLLVIFTWEEHSWLPKKLSTCLPKWISHLAFLPAITVCGSTSCPAFVIAHILYLGHSFHLVAVSIGMSLFSNHREHHFPCLFSICISPLLMDLFIARSIFKLNIYI